MKTPKLSIIVPVYNAEKHLRDCLDSLLCQTVEGGYEIICVNDGSTDSSPKILDEYAEKHIDLVKVFHKSNGGVSSARNYGILNATGDYVTFVDADDYLLPNSVGQVVTFLQRENSLAAIVSGYLNVEDESRFSDLLSSPKLSYKTKNTSSCTCWNLIVSRELINVNEIKFNEKMRIGEDTVFVAECMVYYWENCLKIEGGYYCYRQNPSSVMHTRDSERDLQSHLEMLNFYEQILSKIKKDTKAHKDVVKQFEKRIYAAVSNVLFVAAFAKKDYLKELKERKLYPYPIQWWMLKGNRSLNGFAASFLKQCFSFEFVYKIFYNKMARK